MPRLADGLDRKVRSNPEGLEEDFKAGGKEDTKKNKKNKERQKDERKKETKEGEQRK